MVAAGSEDSGEEPREEAGGTGGPNARNKTERTESGRTAYQDQRMLQTAIKRGWIGGTRWATDSTLAEIEEIPVEQLTLRERAAYAVNRDVGHADPRVRQIAVRNAVAMEKQNQADEHHADGETVHHEHGGHVEVVQVRQELINDADYLEYCRSHSLDADSRLVGEDGESGQVENGKAPGAPGPSTNRGGNGKH